MVPRFQETSSENLVIPTTWSYDKKKMGELRLVPKQFQNKNKNKYFRAIATCLILTHCGNFVIIGNSSGNVNRFNVQSGLLEDDVRGVFSDNSDKVIITGAMDGMIKF
jgi:U3 small nucleolar RNA-associated protein 21